MRVLHAERSMVRGYKPNERGREERERGKEREGVCISSQIHVHVFVVWILMREVEREREEGGEREGRGNKVEGRVCLSSRTFLCTSL